MSGFFLSDWIQHPSHLPLIGSLFGKTPEQEHVEQQLGQMANSYQAYRAPQAQTTMQGLSQRLGAYGPTNQAIGDIYGSKYMTDLGSMMHNPMAPGMTNIGAPPGTATPNAPTGPMPGPSAAILGRR